MRGLPEVYLGTQGVCTIATGPTRTVSTSASAAQVARLLSRLGDILAGRRSAPTGTGAAYRAIFIRMGITALGFIHEAFVQKARGGTDESGLSWRPLSPVTIMMRRHKGLAKKQKRAALRPSAGLTSAQRARWWVLYRRGLAWYKGDKAHAAAGAWRVLKAEGATTLLSRYGSTQVEILRDTGLLENSLSPGKHPDATTTIPRNKNQIFRVGRGEVTIGTNRPWCGTHHEGVPGHIPKRPLWPDPARWPQRWWSEILSQARQGIVDLVVQMVKE